MGFKNLLPPYDADGTAWMALFGENMLELAVELGVSDHNYEDMVHNSQSISTISPQRISVIRKLSGGASVIRTVRRLVPTRKPCARVKRRMGAEVETVAAGQWISLNADVLWIWC